MKIIVECAIIKERKNLSLAEGINALIGPEWQPYGNAYLDRNGLETQHMARHQKPKQLPSDDEVIGRVAAMSEATVGIGESEVGLGDALVEAINGPKKTAKKAKKKEAKNED